MLALKDSCLVGCLIAMAGTAPVPLENVVRVVDSTGAGVSLSAMLDELAEADAVFVGETHLDEVTHDVELAILEGLAERRGGRVVLAMEMFATDAQGAIDDYLAGRIDEPAFMEQARPWKNYRTGYRALVETARARGLPVVGSNISADLRRTIARGGAEAFEALSEQELALLPPRLHPTNVEYWQRFERAVAGHMGRDEAPAEPDPQAYLYSVQSLWDNTMGWSCARALEAHPDHLVLHVNGGFHSKYGQGTVEQFELRRPGATVATVAVVPVADLQMLDTRDAGRAADWIVFAESRARGVQEGFHAVTTAREIRYRVALPEGPAPEPAPMVVWLTEEGLRAADAEAYWRAALGEEAVIVTVEPPYTQLEEDLHVGGHWYWPETFHEDVGALVQALERITAYVGRHFPVDTSRVVIAGAGTGATVVAVTAIGSDRLEVEMIAVDPRRTSKLIEHSLPDLPPATDRLTVAAGSGDHEEWEARCSGYRSAGLDAVVASLEGDGYRQAEHLIRAALSLPDAGGRDTLAASQGSTLARHWARLHARRDGTAGRGLDVSVDDFADGHAIPVPPGPFGGTTVVVVPAGASDEDHAAWQSLADSGAVGKAHGRFYRLRVAVQDADPRLADVLARLREQGRTNVLVVPAVFCADAETMRRLRDGVREHEDSLGGRTPPSLDDMTLTWLPGLGGGPLKPR
jgi:uncharacterized iron-regulated protein